MLTLLYPPYNAICKCFLFYFYKIDQLYMYNIVSGVCVRSLYCNFMHLDILIVLVPR